MYMNSKLIVRYKSIPIPLAAHQLVDHQARSALHGGLEGNLGEAFADHFILKPVEKVHLGP